MDNEVMPIETGGVESKEMDRVSQAFAEAGVKLSEAAGAFARAMQVWVEDVWTPSLETVSKAFSQLAEAWSDWCSGEREKKELIHKALVYGLDGKVVHLTSHKKKRVRKKNLSRLRRMVARYEWSHPSCGSCGNTMGPGL